MSAPINTRKLILAALTALAASGTITAPVLAETTISQPFQGVTWYQRTETIPRKLVMNIVEIDLTFPGISFTATPSNGALPGEVSPTTTRQFITNVGAQIGINGDFYSSAADGQRDLSHLNMTQGQQVSPWSGSGSSREGALNISQNNVATIVRPFNTSIADYNVRPLGTQMWTAVGGNERLLSGGTVIATDTTIHPRTAVGIKGSKLFFFIVDGRQTGYSEGMTLVEIANLLKNDYGITDALNLDGGGSTSLAFADPAPRTINTPSDGIDRVVANSLGVYAPLWPQWILNGNGNYSHPGNWAGGVPNGVGKQGDFKSAITAPRTITLDVPVTLGTINLANNNSYSLVGSALTLDASTGPVRINLSGNGAHLLGSSTFLNDPVEIDTTLAGASAGISFAALNNAGSKPFTKSGPGHLNFIGSQTHGANTVISISGGSTTFSGALTVGAGSSLSFANSNVSFNGPLNLPAGTILQLNGGTSTTNQNIGGPSRLAGVSITGGTLSLNATQRLTSLTLGAGATVRLEQFGNRIINTRALSVAPTSKIDLANNHLIFDYDNPAASPIGTFNGVEYTGITRLLASGYNGGAWNGLGLMTSFNGDKALGIAEASDIFHLSGSETRPFGTETLDSTSVLVKYCSPGDANMDLRIDGDDYFRIDYGFANKLSGWAWGDFNYDGRVTGADYAIIDAEYVQFYGAAPEGLGAYRAAAEAVPEPAVLGGLLVVPALLARRRRALVPSPSGRR